MQNCSTNAMLPNRSFRRGCLINTTMKKEANIIIYSNGARIRFHNKSVDFKELKDGSIGFIYKIVDKDEADIPSTKHKCLRGKVRVTQTKISKESFEAIIQAYIELQKYKLRLAVTPK